MAQSSHADTSQLLTAAELGGGDNVTVQDRLNSMFKPLKTVVFCIIQVLLSLVLCVESIVLPNFANACNVTKTTNSTHNKCATYVIYSAILVWVLIWALKFVVDVLHRHHRTSGYLQLHEKINLLSQIPFLVMAVGNAALLIAVTLETVVDIPKIRFEESLLWVIIQTILFIEFSVIFVSMVIYVVRVTKFNRSRRDPDVFREENMRSMPLIMNLRGAVEIGPGLPAYPQELMQLQAVCERQADLIEYLHRRCDVLSGRLYQANNPV